jgi:hypothetical protein
MKLQFLSPPLKSIEFSFMIYVIFTNVFCLRVIHCRRSKSVHYHKVRTQLKALFLYVSEIVSINFLL